MKVSLLVFFFHLRAPQKYRGDFRKIFPYENYLPESFPFGKFLTIKKLENYIKNF